MFWVQRITVFILVLAHGETCLQGIPEELILNEEGGEIVRAGNLEPGNTVLVEDEVRGEFLSSIEGPAMFTIRHITEDNEDTFIPGNNYTCK